MLDLLTLSIGLGLVVSLIFSETLGKGAGGLVVPGYVALYLTQPVNIALTFVAAFLTFAIVRGLSTFLIVFGKRRTVLMLLTGFAVGALFRMLLDRGWFATEGLELTVIGYIVPALIAIWMDRQGWLDTCTTTLTAAVVVRLALVLVVPQQLHALDAKREAEQRLLNVEPATQVMSRPAEGVSDE